MMLRRTLPHLAWALVAACTTGPAGGAGPDVLVPGGGDGARWWGAGDAGPRGSDGAGGTGSPADGALELPGDGADGSPGSAPDTAALDGAGPGADVATPDALPADAGPPDATPPDTGTQDAQPDGVAAEDTAAAPDTAAPPPCPDAACDDGDPCTLDTCEGGACDHVPRALLPCADPPCPVNGGCLYTIDKGALSPGERLLVGTLQGVLAQHRPGIFVTGAPGDPIFADDLTSYGVTLHPAPSLAWLLERFAPALSGTVLCDLHTDSQNVASTLAGIWGAVAVTPDLVPLAQQAGLPQLLDARGKDEKWAWAQLAPEVAHGIAVEQTEQAPFHELLHDFAVASRAFVYYDGPSSAFRKTVAAGVGPTPLVYGWGAGDEHAFAKGVSQGGGSVVAADWSSNLSVFSRVEVPPLKQKPAPPLPPLDPGAHYVAFVMSDGDNIQFYQNALRQPSWWGSPVRGTVPMTWEASPALSMAAPSILAWYYADASPLDTFVAGPSGTGYCFPGYHADLSASVAQTAATMAATDLRVVSILNDGSGLEAADPYLDQPGIEAAIYKDFADYDAKKGELRWRNGKPAMAYRYLLWKSANAADSPEGVAAAINAAPHAPASTAASYSLVNVHAWSAWPGGPFGDTPMAAVKHTVSLLAPHVRVVSAEELLGHLAASLGPPGACGDGTCGGGETCATCPGDCDACPVLTFEAETDLSHQMGYPDKGGWAAATATESPGHLCYGPYTKAVAAGPHTATFVLMVDVADATNDKVATIDVHDAAGGGILAIEDIHRHDFGAPWAWHPFALPFTAPPGATLETRVYWHDTSYVSVDKVIVQ